MKTEKVHTIILGSGPAGLAAGYILARAGQRPVILEKENSVGGLMRSINRGDFIVDIGRKELYNRIARVDAFWNELLGDDYKLYAHRGGILYDGQIIDTSPAYEGFRRNMPWGMFFGCCTDFLVTRLPGEKAKASTVQEYFYRKRGRRPTQIFSQGFQEKLTGIKWSDIIVPEAANETGPGSFRLVKDALVRTFSAKEPNTHQGIWRHPARGTGQICAELERGIVAAGGKIQLGARLTGITQVDGVVQSATAEVGGETVVYQTEHLLSSIPIEVLLQFLTKRRFEEGLNQQHAALFRKKTVVLAYLFLDESPHFPHAWLNVTCPQTRIGRITNYAALNGKMVPPGKSCLCCEFYCFGDDPLLQLDNEQLAALALDECTRFNLLDRTKCIDRLVLRLPGADASQNRHNWLSKIRLGLMDEVKTYKNLYYVNRTDLDIATLAGIESAEAILSGNRTDFDRHIDPREIGIRSEPKAFEFKLPVSTAA